MQKCLSRWSSFPVVFLSTQKISNYTQQNSYILYWTLHPTAGNRISILSGECFLQKTAAHLCLLPQVIANIKHNTIKSMDMPTVAKQHIKIQVLLLLFDANMWVLVPLPGNFQVREVHKHNTVLSCTTISAATQVSISKRWKESYVIHLDIAQ